MTSTVEISATITGILVRNSNVDIVVEVVDVESADT